MNFSIYIILGIAPSLIWLLYFLRRDSHPEPNSQVLKIFSLGIAVTCPAVIIEKGMAKLAEQVNSSPFLDVLFGTFLGVALVEELLKYLVVKTAVLDSPEFDEPIDAMLYMIITALGFAAVENILLFFKVFLSPKGPVNFFDPVNLALARFLSATFLHALCSATIGFFLAYSLLKSKRRWQLLLVGIMIATILHGFYNLAILKINENSQKLSALKELASDPDTPGPFLYQYQADIRIVENRILVDFSGVFTIVLALAIFVFIGLGKLKKLKSVCQIV